MQSTNSFVKLRFPRVVSVGQRFPSSIKSIALLETAENFRYNAGEHEHTAGYDATCTAICMTKMMAYIAEQTQFKENPMDHQIIKAFTGKSVTITYELSETSVLLFRLFFMRSFDLRYSDILNDDGN